ncbi:hypothetical protein [Thioalkalivibrio thiocyanoxidans]|uniref:hypothetical protein n=1 Tax=Thioalkalivibrio thiocyanoxidans TaxID=152475 RepID=UPI0012DFC285|nr:hypothetical protein [Thioalkalivibrio thiocyanoxidans]
MEESILVAVFLFAVLVFYVPFLLIVTKGLVAKNGRRQFFRSIKNILHREPDDSRAIEQISIIYRQVSGSNQEFSKRYRTPIDICEDLLTRVTGYTPFIFNLHYSLSFTEEEISRLASIIKSIENDLPFVALSPKHGNQLEMLKLAYDSNDSEMGFNGLKQLAKDIKFLESTIETKDKKNRASIAVSVIGVILTIAFGGVSLFQIYTN